MKVEVYDKLDTIIDELRGLIYMIEEESKNSFCTTDVLPADTIRANVIIRRVIGEDNEYYFISSTCCR